MGQQNDADKEVKPEGELQSALEVVKDSIDHDETLRPKDASTKDLKQLFRDEIEQLVDQFRQLSGTDLSLDAYTPEINNTVDRLLDHVSNNVLLDPM
jgi:uncharacterized membrane protein YdfJ with MMPL/SSD domain